MELQKRWEGFAAHSASWLRGLARTRAEEAANKNGLLQAVLQSSPNIVFVKDRQERLLSANPAYFDLFGKTPDEVLGFDVSAFISDPETVHFIRKLEQEIIASGEPRRLEWSWGPAGARRIYIAAVVPLRGHKGAIEGVVGALTDITEQKWNARRTELLSMAATRLLESENPQTIIEDMCRAAMDFLDCQAFLNYLFDESKERLRLNACAGFPEDEAHRIEWLGLGQAICGYAAMERKRIIAENISKTKDTRTDLARSFGIEAYCCHPLLAQGILIGTLAFGSRSRPAFSAAEIEVMKGMADLIAMAMHRIKVEQALRESEERLRLAAQTARFGIHDYDPISDRTLWSPELYAIAGLPPGTEINKAIVRSTVHPEDRQKVASAIEVALSPAGKGAFDEEFRIVRHDTGETRWVQNRCQAFFSDSAKGRIFTRNLGVAIDITERKQREEQLQLLLREVNHRAKNLLAVVQSISFQTCKEGAPGEFSPAFQKRLASLAACHDLIVASEWQGIAIGDLIHSQLSHFEGLHSGKFIADGPPVIITPAAVQTLGMALHELGTNAAKFGALSSEGGAVHITWEVAIGAGSLFSLKWIERGGPTPSQPVRRGFGTTVLTEMAELGLDAEIVLEFPPTGLVWHLSAPAELVLEGQCPSLTHNSPGPRN